MFDFLKYYVIPIGKNTLKDNDNFFNWLFENFAIDFINQFKL